MGEKVGLLRIFDGQIAKSLVYFEWSGKGSEEAKWSNTPNCQR